MNLKNALAKEIANLLRKIDKKKLDELARRAYGVGLTTSQVISP